MPFLNRYRWRALLQSGGLLLLLCANAAQADSPREQWHAQLTQGYDALAQTSSALHQQVVQHCTADNADKGPALKALRNDWLTAFLAWQRIRFIDFGPIEQNSMAWQFQFWPDSKNLIARQVDGLLKDTGSLSAQTLATASVAVKGFPAMEYLLFDENATSAAPRVCDLLVAISGQISANATAVASQWAAFKPHYLTEASYDFTTISAAMHALDILRNARLGAPMGLQGKKRRNPYLADAWRSEQSLTTLKASLQGLQSDFLPGFATLMHAAGQDQLLTQFEHALAASLDRLEQLPAGMSESLNNDSGYRSLQLLFVDIDRLASLLEGPIASELGIVKGFNSSDGD
ncbi:imelysin family protein [Halopseudomonas pelagia]|uniref:imelysin family protein n=1 Tax=Halopseudomonas pelagia TaxID=553151 RepID=UPI0003B46467|nr:imelysin family protein [Halopseudomonas pelagia]|tara:strand:+ start:734 stop:1771 length:1038 start_codon:yes stop_codon:yes gene_type:complete